jgi:DNA primase
LAYPEFITDLAPPHRNYLSARGFDPDNLIRTWSIKGVGSDGGRWSWRVVIPILDRFGTMQSYTGRAIGILVKPRYLTLDLEHSLTNPKHLLYGEHLATDQVIIVEGPTDVWRFGPGAVATLGSSWTLEQAKKLSRFKRRYIMFDNEHTAQKLAAALASQLSPFPGETEIITGLESDPGELEHYRVQRIRRWLGFWPAG